MSKETKVVQVLRFGTAECCVLEVKDGTSKKYYVLICGLKEGRPVYNHLLKEVQSAFKEEIDGIILSFPETRNLTGLSCFLKDRNLLSMVPQSPVPVTGEYSSPPLTVTLEEIIRLLEQYIIMTAKEIRATPEHFPTCFHFTFPEKSLLSLLFGHHSTRNAIKKMISENDGTESGMQMTKVHHEGKSTLALLIAPFRDHHLQICLTGSSYGHEILSDLNEKHLKVFQVPCSGSISHSQTVQVDYLPNENQILQAAQVLALRDLLTEASNSQPLSHETFEREVKFLDWKWNIKHRHSFSVDDSKLRQIQRIAKELSRALELPRVGKPINEIRIKSCYSTFQTQLQEWKIFCSSCKVSSDSLQRVQWSILIHKFVRSTLPEGYDKVLVDRVLTLQEINHRRLQFSVRSIRSFSFYKCFTSDVYIITGCGRYENCCLPNEAVIMGIILAAAKQWKEHKTKCIIQLDDTATIDFLKLDFQRQDFVRLFYLAGKTLQPSMHAQHQFEELILSSPRNVTSHLYFDVTVTVATSVKEFIPPNRGYNKVLLKDFIAPYDLPSSLEVSLLLKILAGNKDGSEIIRKVQECYSNFGRWTVDYQSSFELNARSVNFAELKLDPKGACPKGRLPLKSVTMHIEVVNRNDIRVLLYEKQEELLNRRNLPGELCLDGCCWLNTSDTIFLMAKKPTDKTLTLGDILSFLLTPSCSYLLANGLPLAISEKLITMKLDCSKTAFEFDRVKRKVTRATIVPILSHSSMFIEVGTVRIGITELKLKLNENYECSEKNIHLCGSFIVNGHQVTALSKVDIEGLPKLTLQFKECRDSATILNLLHAHETIVSKEVPLLKKRMNEVPVIAAEVTLLQPSRGSTLLTVQSIHFSTQPTSVFDCLKNYLPATINIVEVNSGSIGIVLGPQPTVCVSSKCTATTATGKQMLVLLNAETYTETGSDMTCSLEVKCMSKQSPLLSHDLDVVLKDSFGIVVENIPFLKSYSKHVQIYKVSLAYLVNTAKTLKKMSISAEISNFKIGPQIEFMGGPLRLDKSEDDIHLNCSGALQIGRYLTFASIQLPTSTTCGYLEVKNHDACFKLADVGTEFQVPEDFLQNISHLVNIKDKPVVKINCVLKMCENMLKITSTEMCLYATEEINFGNIFSLEKATLCLKITTIPAVEVAFTASGFFAITGECKQVMKRFGQWPRGDDIQEKSTNTGMFACVVYKGERVSVEMRAASFCVIDAIKCLEQLFQHGVHVATVGSIKEFIQNTKHIKSMLACAVSEKSSKMHKQGAMFNMRISFQMNVEQFKVVQRVKPDYVQFEMRDIIRLRHFVIDSYDFHYNSSIPDSTKFQIHAVLTKQNCDEGMDLLFKGDTTAITAQLLQRNTGNPLKLSSVLELALCGEPELPNIGIKIPDFIHLYLKKGEIKFSTKKPFEAFAFNVTVIVPSWQLLSIPDISLREIEFTVIWEKGNKPELQLQALFCLAGVHLLFKGFISKANIRCSAKLSSEVSEKDLSAMNLTDIKNRLLQLQQPDFKNLDVQRTLQQLPHPTEGVRKLILHLPDFMRSITFKQLILQLEKEKKGLLCHAQLDASHQWTFPVGCYKLHMLSLGGVIEVWKCLVELSTQYKACLYTQLKMCDLNIKVQVLLNSGGKNIITGYAEATQKTVPCSAILSEIPSCDGSTILGQLLPFKLSDNISEICMVVDITSKTLAILGNYEGLASCVLYLQLANGVRDEMQFVLGIDVPKGFKFGRICKELSFLDDKICVHQAGILIASLKSNTLTEVMEMFEKSVSIFNGVGTYTNTEVVEDNSEKSIEHLALDGIPNIHIPGPNHCETPLSVLNLRETGFFDYTFSKEFVLYGALDFANSHGYMQNTKTFAAKESHIPDLMLAMNVVIPASGDKDKYVRFHGRLNSDFNVINNITVKEATLDYWVQGEKQMVSLSGIVACDIPGCGTQTATNSTIIAKGELYLWKSLALVHVEAFSSPSDTVISYSGLDSFNVSSGRLCELKLFMSTLPQQHQFFEMSIEAPLLSSLMKLRVLIERGNHVVSLRLSEGVTLSDVFKLIPKNLSIEIFEGFTVLSGEIYFSAEDYKLPSFPSAPTDFIPPHLNNVQVVPKQHYCEGYHGRIKVCFFNMWTLELVVDITKSGKFEKISGRFPEPIKFFEIFGLVGSETDTGPDVTYEESENSLTITCGLTVIDKRLATVKFAIVHKEDFHGIEVSLLLDFLPRWISEKAFSIMWSKEKRWQFKIPIFGSVPSTMLDFASILRKLLHWVYNIWRMVTFGVDVWVTIGENIDQKRYFVTFRIHGYFYVQFVGFIKIPAIALPEEGIPIVIEKVDLKTFRLSDIPDLVVKNLKTNAKLLVKYLWKTLMDGDFFEHMCHTVRLAVKSVRDKAEEIVAIAKTGWSAIKKAFSVMFGCVKVFYNEGEIGEILGGKRCQEFKNEEKITLLFGEIAMLLGIVKISKQMQRREKARLTIPQEVSHLSIHENDGQSVNQLKISANELAITVANTVADKLCIQNIKVQITNCITVKWSMEDEVFECDDGDIEYEVLLHITTLNEASTKMITFPVVGPEPVSYKLNASGKLKKLENQYFLSIPFKTSYLALYASISIRASVTMTVRSLMKEVKYGRRSSVTLQGTWHHIQQQVCEEELLFTEAETTCAVKSVAFDFENMTITPTIDESILCSNDNLNFIQIVDRNNTSIVLVRTALDSTCSPMNEIPCESEGPYQVQIVSLTSGNRMVLYVSDKAIHRNPHPHDVQTILPDRLQQGADARTEAKWKVGQSESDHFNPWMCSHCSLTVVDSCEMITCSYTLYCKQTLDSSGGKSTKHTLITAERVKADDNNDFKIDFNLQDAVMNHKCSKACDGTMFDKAKALTLQPSVFTDSAEHFLHSKPVHGPTLYVLSPPKEIKLFCPPKKADIEIWLKYADESLSYQVEVIDKHGSIVQGPYVYHHKEFIRNSPTKKLVDFQEDCNDNLKEVWDSKHVLKIHKVCACLKEYTEYKFQVFSVGYGDQYLMSIVPQVAPQTIQLLPVTVDYDPERDEIRVDFETNRYKAVSYTVELFVFTESVEQCLVSMKTTSSPCLLPLHQYRIIPAGMIRAVVKTTTSASIPQLAQTYLIGISKEELSVMLHPQCTYDFSYMPAFQNYLLEKVDLQLHTSDDNPEHFFGITDYDSNEILYKEKNLNGHGVVRFFSDALRFLLPQLANVSKPFSCFVQSIATPKRVNSNIQKSPPLQCLQPKCIEYGEFVIFFPFHLNNLRNYHAEMQTLRCFIPTNALPQFLLVVLPTTSTGTVPELPEACESKLVNLFHRGENGFLYVHMNSMLSEPLRVKRGFRSKAVNYAEVFKTFPHAKRVKGWIYARCQASTGTTITMTVKKEKKEKKWYTFRGKSEKKELSITFTKPHEVKELQGCSIITVSSNDQVSVSLEVSRYSSCQIFELFVFGKAV